ncbi:MAG: c-type cytochrome domain-containing protein [Deltaproteobacteria bacterium]
MQPLCSKLVVPGLLLAGLLWAAPVQAQGRKIDYNRDIRPLLSNTCYKCHGPDEKERKAGLRLDTQDGAGKKLESGFAAIVPGKSGESELYARIASTDPAEKMPPPNSGKRSRPRRSS